MSRSRVLRLSRSFSSLFFSAISHSYFSQHESSDFADWICLFCLQRGENRDQQVRKLPPSFSLQDEMGCKRRKGVVFSLSFFSLPFCVTVQEKKAIFSEIFPKDFVPFLFVRDRTRREGENDFIFSIFSSTRHCSFGTRCANNCVFCHYLLQ